MVIVVFVLVVAAVFYDLMNATLRIGFWNMVAALWLLWLAFKIAARY